MKKFLTVLILMITLIIPQLGCNAQGQNNNSGISKTSFHLDTVCTIAVYSMEKLEELDSEAQAKRANMVITEAFGICDEYEKILSKTIEGSDVYKINNSQGQWVEVEPATLDIIKQSVAMSELAEGKFDITIGKVSDLWDFHGEDEQGKKTGNLPDDNILKEAVSHVGYENIAIEGNRVRLLDSEAQIDLGGIAKGYIADRVAEYLEEAGVTSAIVDLGGNIVVVGQKGEKLDNHGEGVDFLVGIAAPESGRGELLGTISCADKTVVTSGTYERYFEIEGIRYHHVLDTVSGYPVDTDLLSVTVISDKGNSALCDALSTSALALGKEGAEEFLKKQDNVGAILVDLEGEITFIRAEFS